MEQMTVRTLDLGTAEDVLERGKSMARTRAELPPGNVAAFLMDTRTTRARNSSTNLSAETV